MTEKQIREERLLQKEERQELAKGINAVVDLLVTEHRNDALANILAYALGLFLGNHSKDAADVVGGDHEVTDTPEENDND